MSDNISEICKVCLGWKGAWNIKNSSPWSYPDAAAAGAAAAADAADAVAPGFTTVFTVGSRDAAAAPAAVASVSISF